MQQASVGCRAVPATGRAMIPASTRSTQAGVGQPPSSAGSWVADHRGSLFLTIFVWLQIFNLAVPLDIIFEPREVQLQLETAMAVNPVARAIKIATLLIVAGMVVWRYRLVAALLRRTNEYFLAFTALILFSVSWSIDPGATSARFVTWITYVGICVSFSVASWHPRRFQEVTRSIITLILIGSIIFGLAAPDLAIEQGDGTLKNSWHGLTRQKNQFGQLAGFGTVFWLHAWASRETKWLPAVLGITLSWTCVFLSRSSTSLMATVFVFQFFMLSLRAPPSLKRYMPYLIITFSALIITYAIAVLKLVPGMDVLLEPIAAATGKDLTFSNRSVIWEIIKEHVQLAPMLGSGYGAYWTGPNPWSPSYVFLGRMWFYPTESHNGYIEVVNDLGFVGLLCLLGYLIAYVRDSLRLMRIDRNQGALFLGLFFLQAIMNLSESTWLQTNASFIFLIMTLATVSLARALLEAELRQAFASGSEGS